MQPIFFFRSFVLGFNYRKRISHRSTVQFSVTNHSRSLTLNCDLFPAETVLFQMFGCLLLQIIKDVYNGTTTRNKSSWSFLQMAAVPAETKWRRVKMSLKEKKASKPLTRLVVPLVHDRVCLKWKQKPTEDVKKNDLRGEGHLELKRTHTSLATQIQTKVGSEIVHTTFLTFLPPKRHINNHQAK